MKKIFLVGYYGYGNYGDDLLLKSFLKIFEEIKFDGIIFIPVENLPDLPTNYTFNIQKVSRFSLPEIRKTIKNSDLIVFGGGNLFQSETSLRSFMYYYYIANFAKKQNKKILLLSQGFGSFKQSYELKKLKSLLSYSKLYGVLRDKSSYKYAKKINKNIKLGVDIGSYCFPKIEIKKVNKISVCLKENHDLELLTDFLSTFSNYSLSTLVINANQDALRNYELVEKVRKKTKIKADFPFKSSEKIVEEISQSKIVISDRLHSSLTGIYFESKTITYNNIKNKRVIKNIKDDYQFFYKNTYEIPSSYYDIEYLNYDFKNLSNIYREKILQTVHEIKNLIQNVL
ncbi:polysaccharide pyruvyl transferase family protein [Petrotoga sp. 9PWA.NaAc.5.4]|uniref:polysaccharide pyruvyl transferase family protein n=1 Tax=Petrotoga sp. 9PWA.NaAc.5.4 TaxID=1434328 RepID=UPI000CC65E81|nr:polysaccharide pyruvyl transferase family protein [Petrotoga sp. 9PWA.NaAc.5.4]PNR97195.1 hypothetical protein X924_00495 [Petrotoga sp. 9PWA.NaAc.5.4]